MPSGGTGLALVAYQGPQAKSRGIRLASELHGQGIPTVLAPDKSLKGQMRYASGIGAAQVLILGERELAQDTVTLRDMATGDQHPPRRFDLLLRRCPRSG